MIPQFPLSGPRLVCWGLVLVLLPAAVSMSAGISRGAPLADSVGVNAPDDPRPITHQDTIPPLEEFEGISVGRIYATGNNRSKERVIVQEVLLRPGDPFDVALAEESLRNLRSLSYLSSAEIVPHLDAENETVDVEIVVSDSWPWVGAVIPNFAGGRRELTATVANGNFLGRGQSIGVYLLASNQVADSYSFFFNEPRIFGSRWGSSLNLGIQGDVGPRNRIELFRPLYSLSTPWGYGLSLFNEAQERLLFDSGVRVSDYYDQRTGGSLSAVRSFRNRNRRYEIGASYFYREEAYTQAPGWGGVIPRDKVRATLIVQGSAERFRFVQDTYISLMGPVEDLRLGLRLNLRGGAALKALGSDQDYPVFGGGLRWFEGSPQSGYVSAQADLDTRIMNGRRANTVLASSFRAYGRLDGQGLLAARLQFTLLDRMEDPTQLILDAFNGLRGYPANSFNGERRFLTNLEWRQPIWRPSWVSLGTVLFLDSGIIWSEANPVEEQPYLVGAGAGIRLGFSGFLGTPVVRLDVGYGFHTRSVEGGLGFGQLF